MWAGQETFEVTVTVEDEIFGRKVEPLRNKVTLKRKQPEPEPGSTEAKGPGKSGQPKRD